jgi:hypothetical protein
MNKNEPTGMITLPAHVLAAIARGQERFAQTGRFEVDYNYQALRHLAPQQKIQHFRDGIFTVISQAAGEGRGQPPMVERFRVAAIIVDFLESVGVPFKVGRNSRMNKFLRRQLNDMARGSTDTRKSRRKKITAEAVRKLLREIRKLRLLGDHFTRMYPYAD